MPWSYLFTDNDFCWPHSGDLYGNIALTDNYCVFYLVKKL